MVKVVYVDDDEEIFEIKDEYKPWKWLPEEKAYLISCDEEDVLIPSTFVKCMKHIKE